jgi:hypothetical protein
MPAWLIKDWFGGLSNGDKVGIRGSFVSGRNLDLQSNPDQLRVANRTVLDSSTTVTDLPTWIRNDGTNNDVWALGNTGNLYRKTAGAWSVNRTLTGNLGEGLEDFNGNLYVASTTRLSQLNLSTFVFTNSFQVLNSVTWHPMKRFLDRVFVGNGRTLSSVDASGIWTETEITIDHNWEIKAIETVGDYLVIGAVRTGTITDFEIGKIFLWDGTASRYNKFIDITESGVNALLSVENNLLAIAGVKGNIYQFTGERLIKVKRIPGISATTYAEVYPGAVTNWHGIPHIGLAGAGDDTGVIRGVYTYGHLDKNYPLALNDEYTISTGTTTGTTLRVGSVFADSPTELYIGWRDNTSYGIDLVATATPFATGVYTSRIFDGGDPFRRKLFKNARLVLGQALTTGQSILIEYSNDRGTFSTLGTMNTVGDLTARFDITGTGSVNAREMQLRMTITTNGSPVHIDSFMWDFQPEQFV